MGEARTRRSLPWGTEWWSGEPAYHLPNLATETEALFGSSTSAIVLLDRCVDPSSTPPRDQKLTGRLFARMTERAKALERAGRPDGNAVFDAAYVATMFAQSASFANLARPSFCGAIRISLSQLITGIQLVKHLGRQSDLDFRGTPERLEVTRPADQWVPTGGALLKTTALASWSLS